MSVRVNLLPQATRARERQGKQRYMLLGIALAVLAILALVHVWQLDRVDDAQMARDEAESELAFLRSEEADLQEYADIEQRVEAANTAVTTAMGGEISFAGALQDMAAVTPADAAMTAMDLTRVEGETAADGDVIRPVVARLTLEGESLNRHAPGVERLLLEFDKVTSFFNVHLTTSQSDEEDLDVSIFSVEIDVGEEAYTGRYADGLPEELR